MGCPWVSLSMVSTAVRKLLFLFCFFYIINFSLQSYSYQADTNYSVLQSRAIIRSDFQYTIIVGLRF